MSNQTIIPKLESELFNSLPVAAQEHITRLRANGIAQQQVIEDNERFKRRLYRGKSVDVLMLELTSSSLVLAKFALEAEDDFERNFMFPHNYELLKGYSQATYFAINRQDFELTSED